MPTPRRKKFVRSKAVPLKLQPRDIALLRDVAEYRFLNTPQILALHPGGARNLMRRLSALFEHGYLDRPLRQKTAKLSSTHLVYSLGRKGAEVLIANAEEREGVYRRVKENERTLPLIAHSLMISQFRVCLMVALRKHSGMKLTRWLQGNDLKSALARHGETPPLVADAFFILETPTHKYPCFLEADRATMTQERFVNKLRMYWRHNREERFKQSLGVSNFRVLTITPNEGRAENLRHAAIDADDSRRGSLMYLFLSETRYNVDTPEALLGVAWKSPKD
ncbi:MAG: replication-relaxation family protein, partial [Patescibacteria group bacterium]|nr:replication-relaxation family protein [Patescibacteria group bacterium]